MADVVNTPKYFRKYVENRGKTQTNFYPLEIAQRQRMEARGGHGCMPLQWLSKISSLLLFVYLIYCLKLQRLI